MQTMKYLRAATDPTSPQQLTLFYLLVFQTNKKKSHHVNVVAITALLSLWRARLDRKKGGGEVNLKQARTETRGYPTPAAKAPRWADPV